MVPQPVTTPVAGTFDLSMPKSMQRCSTCMSRTPRRSSPSSRELEPLPRGELAARACWLDALQAAAFRPAPPDLSALPGLPSCRSPSLNDATMTVNSMRLSGAECGSPPSGRWTAAVAKLGASEACPAALLHAGRRVLAVSRPRSLHGRKCRCPPYAITPHRGRACNRRGRCGSSPRCRPLARRAEGDCACARHYAPSRASPRRRISAPRPRSPL